MVEEGYAPLLTLCGQMAMQINSSHISLGILWDIIFIW